MTIKNWRANLILRVVCVVMVAIAPGVEAGASQPSEPKTVADFLLLVPERYMVGYDLRLREKLLRGERRGVVVDVRNGYISYDESDNPSGFEFAIFRKNNGRYIVAYNSVGDDFNREPGDGAMLRLLSYERGRWRDVTKALLGVALNERLGYALPRQGRSIEVTGERGRKLYTLEWRNDRFSIIRAARR